MLKRAANRVAVHSIFIDHDWIKSINDDDHDHERSLRTSGSLTQAGGRKIFYSISFPYGRWYGSLAVNRDICRSARPSNTPCRCFFNTTHIQSSSKLGLRTNNEPRHLNGGLSYGNGEILKLQTNRVSLKHNRQKGKECQKHIVSAIPRQSQLDSCQREMLPANIDARIILPQIRTDLFADPEWSGGTTVWFSKLC